MQSYPIVLPVFAELVLILSIASKPSKYRWMHFLIILYLEILAVMALKKSVSFGSMVKYAMGCHISSTLLFSSTNILLSNPLKDFPSISKQSKPMINAPYRSRLRWAIGVWFNPRCIGFGQPPRLRTPTPQMTKSAFIFRQIRRIASIMITLDVTRLFMRGNPYFYPGVEAESVVEYKQVWRLTTGIFHLASTALFMEGATKWLSIISVGLGFSDSTEWFDFFGPLSEGYTIRRFWNGLWHQKFKRPLSLHAAFITRSLGLNQQGSFYRLATAIIIFVICGLLHALGEWLGWGVWLGREAEFLIAQPFVMLFEDAIIALFTRMGFSKTWYSKAIGYLWVTMWFSYGCLPIVLQQTSTESHILAQPVDSFDIISRWWPNGCILSVPI